MADVYVNALTTISTEPSGTDSVVCVNRNTNEGQIIDYNLLADKVLDKLTSKQYSTLTTTSKLIPGAINELDIDIGTLSNRSANGTIGVLDAGTSNDSLNATYSGQDDNSVLFIKGQNEGNQPRPVGTIHLVISHRRNQNYGMMLAFYGTSAYSRLLNNGTWGNWVEFTTS